MGVGLEMADGAREWGGRSVWASSRSSQPAYEKGDVVIPIVLSRNDGYAQHHLCAGRHKALQVR